MHHNLLVEVTNNGTGVENLPWWSILIFIAVVLIALVFIPWSKIKTKIDDRKQKKTETKQLQPPSKNAHSAFFGIYNWFGKKQAMRLQRTVYVQELEDACQLCRPFENKVLSLEDDDKIMTMKQAIEQGYHHLGCHHIDVDYFVDLTEIKPNQWTDEHKQFRRSLVLKQFKIEDELRDLKYQLDNRKIMSKQKENDLIKKIETKEKELVKFIEGNNLQRNKAREQYNLSDIQKFT
ncbi:hypothetical protein ELUMI_v1c07860 [Williamsoniiplasma luminosum]|uniref:Uncharacterized protein n=1 Tax=Williamsoniiplasma luminosum TaxID=214888 RepID=A0A2K8NWD2_9MOLU|nr:hypothetical protein [Williamsoniiplasma luminosum]ATZ17508.1 hypothetical protein ELUMI_v1c07860 [Williamsoniiplasma luminosum]